MNPFEYSKLAGKLQSTWMPVACLLPVYSLFKLFSFLIKFNASEKQER